MPNKSVEDTFKFLLFSRAFRSIALIYMGLAFSLYPLPLFLGSIFQFASGLSYKLLLKQKK